MTHPIPRKDGLAMNQMYPICDNFYMMVLSSFIYNLGHIDNDLFYKKNYVASFDDDIQLTF